MRKISMSMAIAVFLILQAMIAIPVGLANDGPEHRVRRARPIEMGTSGGNVNNRAGFACCSGTLGAVLSTPDGPAILSNNHIIGRNLDTTVGENVSQPGLIDRQCRTIADDFVGQVAAAVPVDFAGGANQMDAAIALTDFDTVREDGFILDIGPPSTVPVDPALGMAVKKSGRTTGLTRGTIASIGITVNVQARRPCGAVDGVARFVNQIRITPASFVNGGDSGSVVVEDADDCPGMVGLVFAGGSTGAIANPIQPVLDAFQAQLVGCPATGAKRTTPGEFTESHPEVIAVKEVQKKYASIMDIPGVVGTGVGLSEDRQPVLEIYLENMAAGLGQIFPQSLDGIEVRLIETGEFVAF